MGITKVAMWGYSFFYKLSSTLQAGMLDVGNLAPHRTPKASHLPLLGVYIGGAFVPHPR